MREDYCDGLGDCLPACPMGAIAFEEREALAYDEAAVKKAASEVSESRLKQWPVQIKLLPVTASYFEGADLLIAADCTAYAYGNFHNDFIKKRVTLIGCPKLDMVDYTEKLMQIIANNDVKSVTVVRMEVPCCGGIERAVKQALAASKKIIPCSVITITTDGKILEK